MKETTGEVAKLEALTGKVKGGVPFIVKGENSTEYTIPYADSDVVPEGNMLRGTLAPTFVVNGTDTYYGLSAKGGDFRKMADEGNVVPAGKAYLCIEGSSPVKAFALSFDETTGINSIENGELTMDNAEVFNLAGQRVQKPMKGLYIVNGKKVLVR